MTNRECPPGPGSIQDGSFHPIPLPPDREPRRWDPRAIADALGVSAEPRVDELHGQGLRYRLGQPPTTELELFPTASTVRLTTPDLTLSLRHQEHPTLAAEGLVFEAPHHFLSVSPDGGATLHLDPPAGPAESPPEHAIATERPITPTRVPEPLPADAAPPHEVSQAATPEPDAAPEREERVRLAGRLGTEVRYRTTRSGTLIASFPLAIKQEDGTTTWRDVKVFGERAAKLQAGQAPKRGQYTEIIGYVHQKEVRGKDGTARTVEEVYAVVVTPR